MLSVEKKRRKLSNRRSRNRDFAGWPRQARLCEGSSINHSRWYDPIVGRWLSEDPLGLGPDSNPYRYVGNAPTNEIDLSGLAPLPPGAEGTPSGDLGLQMSLLAQQQAMQQDAAYAAYDAAQAARSLPPPPSYYPPDELIRGKLSTTEYGLPDWHDDAYVNQGLIVG